MALAVDRFASPRLASPDWSSVTAGPLWTSVSIANGDIEISRLTIRLLTDPVFRAYWEERSNDQ